jgi:hypothetical protein
MGKWAQKYGSEINKAPFFTEQRVKDIVGLQFNPGKGVAHFSSAQCGISILTCRPKSAVEVEQIKGDEEAHWAMAHTVQYTEYRRCQKKTPSPPPDTYFELKLSINTFCTLLCMLFGEECDYYHGLSGRKWTSRRSISSGRHSPLTSVVKLHGQY